MGVSTKSRLRAAWAVPAAVALAIGAVAAAPAMSQAASPDLPEISAQDLLTNLAKAEPQAFSGSVSVTADLGLPDLSSLSSTLGAPEGASPLSLATGSHTVKVWSDPGVGQRANIQSDRSEYSIVATPTDVWTYSSQDDAASHLAIPADAAAEAKKKAAEHASDVPSPGELASKLLTEVQPSTNVVIDRTASVAGRDCYQLVATPKDDGSLIASVRVAIDAKTWQPLRAQVYSTANADKPALESAFTAIDYAAPAASVFQFSAPKGADVTEIPWPDDSAAKPDAKHSAAGKPDVTVTDKGWASIVEISNAGELMATMADGAGHNATTAQDATESDLTAVSPDDADLSSLLGQLSTQVDGGTLYSTNLFSLLITDDGRVFAGAVPGSALQAAAK